MGFKWKDRNTDTSLSTEEMVGRVKQKNNILSVHYKETLLYRMVCLFSAHLEYISWNVEMHKRSIAIVWAPCQPSRINYTSAFQDAECMFRWMKILAYNTRGITCYRKFSIENEHFKNTHYN